MRYGDYIVKVALKPASSNLQLLQGVPVDLQDKPDGLREAVAAFFSTQGGEWDVCVQFCTNSADMPIEDASVVWPEDQSPYLPVARISVQPQSSWSDQRAAAENTLSFSPWHGLAAHRPLGSIMRVRKAAYEAARLFRAEHNQVKVAEPRDLDAFLQDDLP